MPNLLKQAINCNDGDAKIIQDALGISFPNSGDGVTPVWPSGVTQYAVVVSPSQNCFWTVSSKTASGFTVTLSPVNSTTTLSAGTFDALVIA
jgi:hypothetical protein